MNVVLVSIRSLIFFTFLLGGIYPLLITLVGSTLSPIRSHGSLLKIGEKVVGSELIGQNFTQDKYFWSRPSVSEYDPLSSTASQRSVTDKKLKEDYLIRKKVLTEAPQDLLWASGSGLDPHISIEAAKFQKARIIKARNISEQKIDETIKDATEDRFLGFMGQPRVNVLELNMLLDK